MASTSQSTSSESTGRNLAARILAPLALVACIGVVYVLISDARPEDDAPSTDKKARSEQVKAQRQDGPETYVVQSGDTLTGIAQATGVPTAKLGRLNPDLDTATLNPGQTVKLR